MIFVHTKLFINNEFIESSTKFETNNPFTQSPLTTIHRAEKEHVESAIKSAKEAFNGWKQVASSMRSKFLHKLADEIDNNSETIAVSIHIIILVGQSQ